MQILWLILIIMVIVWMSIKPNRPRTGAHCVLLHCWAAEKGTLLFHLLRFLDFINWHQKWCRDNSFDRRISIFHWPRWRQWIWKLQSLFSSWIFVWMQLNPRDIFVCVTQYSWQMGIQLNSAPRISSHIIRLRIAVIRIYCIHSCVEVETRTTLSIKRFYV